MSSPSDDWTALANDIRTVDGNHDLGAGELAARLIERGWTRELDVERLARALVAAHALHDDLLVTPTAEAIAIAREYAALSETSHD